MLLTIKSPKILNQKAQEDISDFHSFYIIVILYSFLPYVIA